MPSREESERNVRIDADTRNGKNGRNGAHMIVEATGPERQDNSVEKSLEDFIARANSTFLSDGWDLTAEQEAKPPEPAPLPADVQEKLAELEQMRGEVDKLRARATSAEARAAEAVKVKAVTPIAPAVERTEVVRLDQLEPKIVTRTNWGATFVALVAGAGIMFGVMKFVVKDGGAKTVPAVEPPATSVVPTAAPAPAEATPAPAPAEAAPTEAAPAPGAPPGEPIVQPLPTDPAATAAPAPAEATPAPAEAAPATPPAAEAAPDVKAGTKKATTKKATTKKATTDAKGGIVDPFGDSTPAPKKKPTPKKKPKSTQPKGGIVDPFAM
jgi:hypothetical protein